MNGVQDAGGDARNSPSRISTATLCYRSRFAEPGDGVDHLIFAGADGTLFIRGVPPPGPGFANIPIARGPEARLRLIVAAMFVKRIKPSVIRDAGNEMKPVHRALVIRIGSADIAARAAVRVVRVMR
ncbi:hypothetical protein [Paraburkholderia sp. SIMBA_054]|uniref:hypothetical protein n=1 Tax=Paraburkholderia sp. SIMBA_054 TaxID=3085795 RepID=UPI00397B62AD